MGRQSTYPPPPVAIELELPAPIVARPRPARPVPQFTRARDSHARWQRAVNAIGGSFEPVGKPSADIYWERAQRLNPDAGDPTRDAQAALTALTESLNQDAALNFIGKIAAWIDCTRMAGTHLRVEQALRETPAIEETPLPNPGIRPRPISQRDDGPASLARRRPAESHPAALGKLRPDTVAGRTKASPANAIAVPRDGTVSISQHRGDPSDGRASDR